MKNYLTDLEILALRTAREACNQASNRIGPGSEWGDAACGLGLLVASIDEALLENEVGDEPRDCIAAEAATDVDLPW
jgi:hypothetical protein